MNQDYILRLFQYFSKYVPKPVLTHMLVQPEHSTRSGYASLSAEILSQPDTCVISDIGTFVCSTNRNYVSEKIKNSDGIILFVEYGSFSFNPLETFGVTQKLAITVCHEFNMSNHDNLNEILLMNKCNNLLNSILVQMQEDQTALEACGLLNLIKFPAEVIPIEPETFFGRSGWTALFENENSYN